ncbi:MAG: hypothetical protein SCARUB_05171 [Candidatus Scalindua rubra]|uniref:Uncharacterized protein n=1 Tax=Candidatus Scalindua rubra TaxID=1872076 RepID=A0A1E3X276_9BACT|nr:MAG: hypothetical protein SCARUB_05171 [Candidatus Scalindua rubra]
MKIPNYELNVIAADFAYCKTAELMQLGSNKYRTQTLIMHLK